MGRIKITEAVGPGDIHDAKTYLRLRTIPKLGKARANFPYFSLADVRVDLESHHKGVEPASVNQYLCELAKQRVVFDAGRGWYSTLREPFLLDREPVRELVENLEQGFPLLDFSVWSTAQVAGYGHHQLAHFTHFVNTERDAMESVAEALRDAGRVVYLDPDKRELGRNVRLADGVIIVRPAVTKAPVEGKYATIEKILVDLFIEAEDLKLMDAAEHRNIVQSAVSRGRISIATMLSYAERRRLPDSRLIPSE